MLTAPLNSTMITGSKTLQMVADDHWCANEMPMITAQKSVQLGDTKVH